MPRLDAIGVVVSDMARAVTFYRHLGLEFEEGLGDQPHTEAVVTGGIRLMLDTEATVTSFSDWEPPSGGSPRIALVLCDDAGEVDLNYRRLLDAGGSGQVAPCDAPWGQRYATVHDADGSAVDLFAPL